LDYRQLGEACVLAELFCLGMTFGLVSLKKERLSCNVGVRYEHLIWQIVLTQNHFWYTKTVPDDTDF